MEGAVGGAGAAVFEVLVYMFNRLPAPHVSAEFPGQAKLQSVEGADTLPGLIVSPQ